RAACKKVVREFLYADQEGQDQAAYDGHPPWALGWKRAQERQVDQQGQDPIQDEMSHFITVWDLIDKLQKAKLPLICQNNDKNNKESKKKCDPLHVRCKQNRDALERLDFCFFGFHFAPRFQGLPYCRNNGDKNDGKDDKFKVLFYKGNVAKEITQ